MAYTSKYYQRSWSYEPDGTDFNARVGRILAQGADLKASLKAAALRDVKGAIEFENEQKSSKNAGPTDNMAFYQQTSSSGKQTPPDGRGMVWVDAEGNVLDSSSTSVSKQGGPEPVADEDWKLSPGQKYMKGLDPTQRSMHLWRRVNPGCMETTTKVPVSTFKDHYHMRPELEQSVDKTSHLKKTDFSDYTEARLRVMQHLKNH